MAGDGSANATVSPSGVAAVLATLELGADKTMRSAIAQTLGLSERSQEGIASLRADARLLAVIAAQTEAPYAAADGLFVADGLPLAPGIEDRILAESRVRVETLDFASPDAVARVNRSASDQTRGRIASILEPGSTASLVAVNGFSFSDCWRVAFAADRTTEQPFHRRDGTAPSRPFMRIDQGSFPYAASGRFAAVELAYADGRFALTLVTTTDKPATPDEFYTAKDAVGLLSGSLLQPATVTLSLPKFTGTGSADLLPVLARLGLGTGLRSPTHLAGFAEGLSLTAVRQKTAITVDESGTEAAAVTAAVTSRAIAPQPRIIDLAFDKPFVFALRHRETGIVLLIGYVADPAGGPK